MVVLSMVTSKTAGPPALRRGRGSHQPKGMHSSTSLPRPHRVISMERVLARHRSEAPSKE